MTVLDRMVDGTAREEPQDDSQATYAPKLTKEEGLIDWAQSARAIHDRVRGLYPWPLAYSYLHGQRLIIRRTQVPVAGREGPPYGDGGTILAVDNEAIRVATGEGELDIGEIQPEGRRPMSAREFVAGHPVVRGDVFSSP
jgi:methionyl-tRNA formyltransferase